MVAVAGAMLLAHLVGQICRASREIGLSLQAAQGDHVAVGGAVGCRRQEGEEGKTHRHQTEADVDGDGNLRKVLGDQLTGKGMVAHLLDGDALDHGQHAYRHERYRDQRIVHAPYPFLCAFGHILDLLNDIITFHSIIFHYKCKEKRCKKHLLRNF